MSEESTDIKEVKSLLNEIYEKALEIKDVLKEKYNSPATRTEEEILTDPDILYYSLFENFWKLFNIISKNIENPLILPWVRIIIEQFSDILWYSQKNEIEKRNIACKYFLCNLGFVGGKEENLSYDNLLNLLESDEEKVKFEALKNKGFPKKEFHKILHKLFPPISENSLPNILEKYFLNLKNNSIKKNQLDMFYRDMSFYHHPSLAINNLEKEFKDKSHIFRCFALISVCGISLIGFSAEKQEYGLGENFIENLNKKLNNLFKNLYLGKVRRN